MVKKVFQKMLLTQIISSMAATLCMLIDSIMIGRYLGVDAMAAYGLANPLLLLFAAIGCMLSTGVQFMCSKALGTGDSEETNRCYTITIATAAVISALAVAVVIIFADPICVLLGAERGSYVFKLTKDYLIGFIIGAPGFIAAQVFVPFMQMSGKRSLLVIAVSMLTVTDVIFDILNVTVFNGGTFGMGIASSLSYYVALAIGLIYFLNPRCIYKFSKAAFSLDSVKRLLEGGVPTVINQFSYMLLVLFINNRLISVGGDASVVSVAAYSVIMSLSSICFCVGSGIGAVSLMLGGIFYNEEDRRGLFELLKVQMFFCIVIDAVVTLIVLLGAKPIALLFLDDVNIKALKTATFGVRMFSLCLILSALNTSMKNYYQATGRIKLTEVISVLQNLALPGLYVLIVSNILGTRGIWLNFVVGEGLTFAFITVYSCIKARSFEPKRKPCPSIENYAMLRDDFGPQPDEFIEAKIKNTWDISTAACELEKFCATKPGEEERGTAIEMSMMEIAASIIKHGFEDNRDNIIEIKLVYRDGDFKLRIRDNCSNFDPAEYLELHKAGSSDAHKGIRQLFTYVTNVSYVNSLGLNNLLIELGKKKEETPKPKKISFIKSGKRRPDKSSKSDKNQKQDKSLKSEKSKKTDKRLRFVKSSKSDKKVNGEKNSKPETKLKTDKMFKSKTKKKSK